MKKLCPQCNETKEYSEYYNNKKYGVSSWCQACDRAKSKLRSKEDIKRYRKNDEQNRLVRKQALRKIADDAKGPCVDCGKRYHPCAMDFHHRNPEEKVKEISKLVGMGCSQKRLIAEIAKCDVVCAICHRMRHFRETALRGDDVEVV